MPTPFLLDTNAYFLLFQTPKPPAYAQLVQKIQDGQIKTFYISEVTSIEIHSVLGKHRRGIHQQRQQCKRNIVTGQTITQCSNVWVTPGKKKLKRKVFRDIQKVILDVEARRGDIQATILELDQGCMSNARRLLTNYSAQHLSRLHGHIGSRIMDILASEYSNI